MAQRAFVPQYTTIMGTSNLNEMTISFTCMLLEEGNQEPLISTLSVLTSWSENMQTIENKIVDAIVAHAVANNYSTLQPSAVILPQYAKG